MREESKRSTREYTGNQGPRRRKDVRVFRLSPMNIAIFAVVLIAAVFLLNYSSAAIKDAEIPVKLTAQDAEIMQGETLPAFTATASCDGDLAVVLDEESGYTVGDLVKELNEGQGFSCKTESDGTLEGEYAITPELTSAITTPLFGEWFGKVKIVAVDGTLKVKNPLGEWDGEKFRTWEGNYLTNSFLTYKGQGYYFDENGNKATGWKDMNGFMYYFNDDGVMAVGWTELENSKYYFSPEGHMTIGWLTLDDKKYYFANDGKMLTGNQKVGTMQCEFAEDGHLVAQTGGVDPNKPMVALTFDDGPGPRTLELLAALEEYGARATFFMLGQNVLNYADAVKKMEEINCELANHSYSHPYLSTMSADEVTAQIEDTNSNIASIVGHGATVMRPPYGAISQTMRETISLPMILWSIDTLDWKTRNVQSTIETTMENVQDGDIILMHDIHSETIDAAIQLIPMLQEAGYQLVTVSEMAEAKGITWEQGKGYGRMQAGQ